MARTSREAQLHAEWIGMAQPDGLVVAVPVLEEAGVYVRRPLDDQQALREATPDERIPNLETVFRLLGWPPGAISDQTEAFTTDLPDLGATLRPDRVVRDRKGNVLLLVCWTDDPLHKTPEGARWPASHGERFERLLLDQAHPVGLLVCPTELRLVYAPAGEAPGRLTFCIADLHSSEGRLLVDALHMLLGARALLTGPPDARLRALLEASRKRQERVTEDLAKQVEEALRILLAGFDTANERSRGALLRDVSTDELYDGLTTVLLRLVFLLYAEDRELLPIHLGLYQQHYSVSGLADQLQQERVHYASAMDRRFGAWARLISLFRMVWSGARYGELDLPPRQGALFFPDRFPFLEGRVSTGFRTDRVQVPRVDDGVITRVLDRLLHLNQQRISYRNLEVEQLGSVYESLMGFEVRKAAGACVTTKPDRVVVELGDLREAADPVRSLAEMLGDKPAKLRKKVPELPGFEATEDIAADLQTLRDALGTITWKTDDGVRPGRHYLQPGEERRRSGSHYTPRSLTEPIVARTLGPVLERGGPPTPEQILALKVCDPAMGSGAFLAEACRYLAKRLVEAWGRTGTTPPEALERDPELLARRLVAERCLYGVDKNPKAVQLARLSLWLVTSTKDLPFTFIDHALKEGDALIGLDIEQIATFSFERKGSAPLWDQAMRAAMQSAARMRAKIIEKQQHLVFGHDQKKSFLNMADEEVWDERKVGDLVLACAWDGGSKKAVRDRLKRMAGFARAWYPNPGKEPMPDEAAGLIEALPLRPFHWALEFPEVFSRKKPGFDCVIGNPPFGGKNTITSSNGAPYIHQLRAQWPHSHGNSDLVAYFFLRALEVLRPRGGFGLVATNTISQGNTRTTGLKHLVLEENVTLYDATIDLKWPVAGAAVTVSVVHGCRGRFDGRLLLDGDEVSGIASDLRAGEELPDPTRLVANRKMSFIGSYVLGSGFVLTLEEAAQLRAANADNTEIVRDYLGGQELNSNIPATPYAFIPHSRCVISFGERTLEEAEAWPQLLAIVQEKVKPERDKNNREIRRRYWWRFGETAPGLYRTIAPLKRCLVCARISKHYMVTFQPTDRVLSEMVIVFAFDDPYHFALLQSRTHEHWARLLASSMKTDMRYTPSRCFETFPFPRPSAPQRTAVAAAGQALYTKRAEIMVADQQGMTQVWNRLVDPGCTDADIIELRQLRDAMDRAVLAAYSWSDLDPTDRDAILTRLRKLNAERAAEEARGT